MLIHLSDYCYGYKIVSLALNDECKKDLIDNDLPYIYFDGATLYLSQECITLSLNDIAIQKFSICNNYDVFEISPEGIAYQFYNCASIDNAFVITELCNSNCIMCPTHENIRKKGTIYELNKLLTIIKHIPDDAVHFTITGGEPFMMGEEIFVFLNAIKNKFDNTDFLLLTNGRIFSLPLYCNKLKDTMPNKMIIGIPLHGYNEITHDFITQTQGSFIQTHNGIRNLIKIGAKIELRIVVSSYTIEYLQQMVDLIISDFPKINSVKFMGMEMTGNARQNHHSLWVDYSRIGDALKQPIITLIKNQIDVAIYNLPLCTVPKNLWSICKKSISDYKVRFSDDCDNCIVKDACGGIFAGSFRYETHDLKPIKVVGCND